MRSIWILAAALLSVAAAPVDDAAKLIEASRGKEAVAILEKAAATKDADAADYLAQLYDVGEEVSQDLSHAATLYRQAAELGNTHAQWRLGVMLDMGEGVKENPKEAVEWFRKAAAQGDRSAIVSLAVMHSMGRGVTQDFRESMRLYREAARRGEPHGFYGVGILHARGEGVPEDRTEAFAWMLAAATTGDRQAKELIEKEAFIDEDGQKAAERANEILREFGHESKRVQFRDLDAEQMKPQPAK